MKTILILKDRLSPPMGYMVDHLALRWRKTGHTVIEHIGIKNMPDADIVFLHIDLTITPVEFIEALKKYPKVINGNMLDISRRKYSQLLLGKDDNYAGRVIVKTNANYGGIPEYVLKTGKHRIEGHWHELEALDPLNYPIFKNINAVPNGVWRNPNLIVERFLQDRHNDLFHVQYYTFLGNKMYSARLASASPIVKFGNCVSDVELPLPDKVLQWRKDLKMDYGRLDYLKIQGEYYLIDINKTEGGGDTNYEYSDEMDYLASGLTFYLDS